MSFDPRLLKWADAWNEGKAYDAQIRPFGFLLSFMPRTGLFASPDRPRITDPSRRGRPRKCQTPKPVAPFDRSHQVAVQCAFDRETGRAVHPDELKTYAEALAQFHLSAEDKFLNGDFCDAGETRRRQIIAANVSLIGKEANKVGPIGGGDPMSPSNVTFSYRDAEA